MNATHSRMRSVASTLVGTRVVTGFRAPWARRDLRADSCWPLFPKGPQAHTVVIREVKFQPTVLTVKLGDTVEWRNDDIGPSHRNVDRTEGNSTPAFFRLAVPGIVVL